MNKLVFRHTLLLVLCASVGLLALAPAPAAAKDRDEVEMGREASAELEKQYKVVEDEALQERVNKIGSELAAIANEVEVPAIYGSSHVTKFEYIFKVLDDKDVNALSMPGGFIYINKGLVDYAQSDDELAGVIAHEIAHISHHHMMDLVKEQAKLNNQLAIALLASILSGAPAADIGNVMMGARFITIAKLNGYTREAEADADMTAIAYMKKSKYNPVGMLTFMERLARDEINRPAINWGVYQTHPYPAQRSREITRKLQEMGIKIDRRAVTKAPVAEVKKNEESGRFELWVGGKKMFEPADGPLNPEERLKTSADTINRLLDDNLRLRDVKHTKDPPAIIARGNPILEVTAEDAALQEGKTPQQVSRDAYDVLYKVLFDQEMQRIY